MPLFFFFGFFAGGKAGDDLISAAFSCKILRRQLEEEPVSVRSQTPAAGQDAWTVGKAVYAVLTGALLLSYLYVILTYREGFMFNGGIYALPVWIWVLRLVSVGMTLVLGKVWKDKGFWILMAYLLLMVVRLLLENSIRLFALSVSESLLCGMWVYIACYGLARVLSLRQLKQLAMTFAALWTMGMVVLSGVGLYAYWTDQKILNLTGTAFFGVWEQRLTLCYIVTGSAATISLSFGIAMLCFLSVRKKIIKVAYGLAMIVLLTALVLSSTRTANITAGINLGICAGIGILHRYYMKWKSGNEKPSMGKVIGAWLLALMAAGIVLAVVMFGLMRMVPVMNNLKTRGGIVSIAFAENASTGESIVYRSYFEVGLNKRVDNWKAIITYLKNNPTILLTGASIFYPMEGIGLPFPVQHAHCRMLMTVLESGVPGLLLYLLFYGYIVWCSLRLVKSGEHPRWIRLLPSLVAGLVIGDLVECLTWLQAGGYLMLPFLFAACGVISTYGSKKEVACE